VEQSVARATYVTAAGSEHESALSEVDLRQVAFGSPFRIPPSYAGQRNYPGLFYSSTNSAHVVYESRLELSWLWLADFDPEVVRIAAQPMLVVGRDGSRDRVRIPDFLALYADGRAAVVDVKPDDMLDDAEVRDSLAWTARTFADAGIEYAVWSGVPETLLRNVRLVASARRTGLVPDVSVEAAVRLCPVAGGSIAELERSLGSAGGLETSARAAVFAALWRGRLRCDMSRPIDRATEVVPA